MKKIEFELSDELYKKASSPIRNKEDLLMLLAYTIKFLITNGNVDNNSIAYDKKLVLYVDKMSRVFFSLHNKIFSFCFPFSINIPQDNHKISIKYKGYFEFDNISSSLLLSILEQNDIISDTFENIGEKIFEIILYNEWESIDYNGFCVLIKGLMMFEPGYIRYDYDPEHASEELHPLHHLDVFYSSNCTAKLGLKDNIDIEWLIDLLNIRTKCKYVD